MMWRVWVMLAGCEEVGPSRTSRDAVPSLLLRCAPKWPLSLDEVVGVHAPCSLSVCTCIILIISQGNHGVV